MGLVSTSTLLEQLLLIRIQQSFVEWYHLERISAIGLITRPQPINIRARRDGSVAQESAEVMLVPIDLLTLAEEH
jgi:hypothetical protein